MTNVVRQMMIISGPFSRSAVNYNAGCKTAASNIVMAIAVMLTLLFLTPLFYYTPLVVLAAIIVSAMLGLIDYEAAIHLWKIDKFDFVVCVSAYFGVVFGSVQIGLVIAVCIINNLHSHTSESDIQTNMFFVWYGHLDCGISTSVTAIYRTAKNICFRKHSEFCNIQKH